MLPFRECFVRFCSFGRLDVIAGEEWSSGLICSPYYYTLSFASTSFVYCRRFRNSASSHVATSEFVTVTVSSCLLMNVTSFPFTSINNSVWSLKYTCTIWLLKQKIMPWDFLIHFLTTTDSGAGFIDYNLLYLVDVFVCRYF